MPVDIYNRETSNVAGVFVPDRAVLSFGSRGANGVALPNALSQDFQIQYSQAVETIYELDSPDRYLVQGRSSGQMSIGHVMGPRAVMGAMLRKYGDVCQSPTNAITANLSGAACAAVNSAAAQTSLTSTGLAITQFSMNAQAQTLVSRSNVAMMFASLQLTDGS